MSLPEKGSFSYITDNFLVDMRGRRRDDGQPRFSDYTTLAYTRDARRFCLWLEREGAQDLSRVNGDQIARYGQSLNDGKLSPATQTRGLFGLKVFLQWTAEMGLTIQGLAGQVCWFPPENAALPPFLTIRDVEGFILAAARPKRIPGELAFRDPALIAVLSSGATCTEAANMNVGDVAMDADQVSVNLQGIRSGNVRTIELDPLSAEFMSLHLRRHSQDSSQPLFLSGRKERISRQGCWYIVNELSEELDAIPPITPTRLRYASALREGGEVLGIMFRLGINRNLARRIARSIGSLEPSVYESYGVAPIATLKEGKNAVA